jgi:hypothetical protein
MRSGFIFFSIRIFVGNVRAFGVAQLADDASKRLKPEEH